jgi:hypothetical protein
MRHPRFHLSAAVRVAVLTLLATFVASSDASAQSKPSVAVLGLEVIDDGTGVDPQSTELAKMLTQALREGTRQDVSPYRMAPNSDKELLEVKLLSGCANEARNCMAQIGRDLGAEWLIYGKIEKRDTGYQVTLKLLKVDTTAMERVTTEVIPFADNDEKSIRQKWGRSLYNRLTGIPDQGNLTIQANVDQGRVFIDGQLATTLRRGRARIDGLVEGKHDVAIEAGGHSRYEASVEIRPGATENLDARLQTLAVDPSGGGEVGGGGQVDTGEERPGGTSRTLFWVAAGVTVLSTAGHTISYVQLRSAKDDTATAGAELVMLAKEDGNETWRGSIDGDPCGNDFPDSVSGGDATQANALLREIDGHCKDGDSASMRTWIFGPLAIASGLATGYFFYRGYMASDTKAGERSAGRARKSAQPTVQVAPTITPDYFGAGVKIVF